MSKNFSSKPDKDFPFLSEDRYFDFSPLFLNEYKGVIGIGANLSPGMLLSAYKQGVFPWYSDEEPITWWSPDPRFVLFPEELHVSKTMKKLLKKQVFTLTIDKAFAQVIEYCSNTFRPGQSGTWITNDMIEAYINMHKLGYAHSVEAWLPYKPELAMQASWTGESTFFEDKGLYLVGGFYGMSLGRAFFGESMFSLVPDASKAAFIPFVQFLQTKNFAFIDSQVETEHVASLGGKNIPRLEYFRLLKTALQEATYKGNWAIMFNDFGK